MARKNRGTGINIQCSYKKKFGNYCGFHKDVRLRIDQPLPPDYKTYKKHITKQQDEEVIKKPAFKLKHKIEIIDNQQTNRLITIEQYLTGVHMKCSIKDLRYCLHHYEQPITGSKADLIKRLSKYFNEIIIYQPHIAKILTIQRKYRQYLEQKILNVRGPGFFDRDVCMNDYDFYTCQDKSEIEQKYFISYKDNNNLIFCFDIRSLQKLVDNAQGIIPINPYNLMEIPIDLLTNVNNIIDYLKKHDDFEPFEEPDMTPQQIHRDKIISVFHKLDELDNHTRSEWFTNLTLKNLNKFYHNLIEIWTFRAGLTNEMRNCIVPGDNLFEMSQTELSYIKDRKKVHMIIINVIDKLISSAESRSDKILGSLYVLTALSEVSKECAKANNFLL